MKKRDADEPRDEYDFSGGVRGRYYERSRSGPPTFHIVSDAEDRKRRQPVEYAVIYEKSETGYSAYVPDLPGCIATGRTRTAVKRRVRTAIQMHLELMAEGGEAAPPSNTWAEVVRL